MATLLWLVGWLIGAGVTGLVLFGVARLGVDVVVRLRQRAADSRAEQRRAALQAVPPRRQDRGPRDHRRRAA